MRQAPSHPRTHTVGPTDHQRPDSDSLGPGLAILAALALPLFVVSYPLLAAASVLGAAATLLGWRLLAGRRKEATARTMRSTRQTPSHERGAPTRGR